MIATIEELLLALFLFGFCFCGASVALTGRSPQQPKSFDKLGLTSTPESNLRLTEEFFEFACRLEDAPATSLTGQFYQLARSLMSPLACLLEDAPATALTGQFYQLAIALMSPLACRLEDAPATALKGQAYQLMSPLMSPLACKLEDAPATALTGQFYQLMSDFACSWEDAPATALTGQAYQLMSPLMSPLASRLEDAPATALKGQAYQLMSPLMSDFACRWEDTPTTVLTGQVCQLMNVFACRLEDVPAKVFSPQNEPVISRFNRATTTPKVTIHNLKELELILQENSSWWTVLGVQPNTNRLQVETAYKKLIRKWHPDLNRHPKATEATSRINVAYEDYKLSYAAQLVEKKAMKKNYLSSFVQILRRLIVPGFSR
ncbi:MAG: J domain-containing protein [Kamptonema sp. SIO1D9]|nr:J domain-containing protein [Kamptonema sp. SIO1D9]